MLAHFIKSIQPAIKQLGPESRVLFVSGNESADLDSCASSILTAYFFSQFLKKNPHKQSFQPDAVIPLLNIPRADLNLRPELSHLLTKLKVEGSNLFCLDDLNKLLTQGVLAKQNCYSFLVDFNAPTASLLDTIGDNVVGIIDHHDDEGLYPNASPRIIQKTGSCSSLVVNYFNEVDNATFQQEDPDLLYFASAPLLVDTSNLKAKVEEGDLKAFKTLKTLVEQHAEEIGFTEFYKIVQYHKTNLNGMSARDILRKDYKQWDSDNAQKKLRLGMSSVQASLEWLKNEHEEFDEEILNSAKERSVDVYVVMSAFSIDGKFHRELAIYPISDETEPLIEEFINQASDNLQLRPKTERLFKSPIKTFDQGNVASSRKQVAPLLRTYLHGAKLSQI